MAGRIPESFIDDLMSRVDITDVIDARVPLKKAGREYKACCPFHGEKTPSFYVSPQKQFYHCFGCGAHGTAIGFLMDYEHLSYVEAIEELASSAGLEVPYENTGQSKNTSSSDKLPLYEALEQASQWFSQQLRQHPQAHQAVDYLKGRGLSGEIAARYGLGYAPPGWDNLCRTLNNDENLLNAAEAAGLIAKRENGGFYDRFRDRAIFPIKDRRGRIIAFGGRVLGDDTPKYLNSPETEVFHKGKELYGLYEARKHLRQIDRILVVEGYMDVVSLAQFGVQYAVATLGTATSADHLDTIFRLCDEVVFCFDGDRAGRDAAWKALQVAIPKLQDGRQIRFLLLPDGEDPDTLIRCEGSDAFEERLVKASPFSEFFIRHFEEQVDTNSIDGRARGVELAKPLIQKMPNSVLRQVMVQKLATLVDMTPQRLEQIFELGKTNNPQKTQTQQPIKRESQPSRQAGELSPVARLIAMLVQRPGLAPLGQRLLSHHSKRVPGVSLLLEILEILESTPTLTTAAILERWRDKKEARHLTKLAQWRSEGPEDAWEDEFAGLIHGLERRFRSDLYSEVSNHVAAQNLKGTTRRYIQLHLKSRSHPLTPEEHDEYDRLFDALIAGLEASDTGAET